MSEEHEVWMSRALALGRAVAGSTSPNPAVGAVLVRAGHVIGEGATQPPGGAHAEIVALRQAGPAARGATLYVTLEPCSHHGRTPPCTDALIAAGVAAVHYAVADPNPVVAGRGREALREAGIIVVEGEGAREAALAHEAFFTYITRGRPFVIAKWAMSLDGKIATVQGDSRWISGEEARQHGHRLRATVDAIGVGSGTVLADNPALTTRVDGVPAARHPLRIVLDARGRTPLHARVLAGQLPGQTLVGHPFDMRPLSRGYGSPSLGATYGQLWVGCTTSGHDGGGACRMAGTGGGAGPRTADLATRAAGWR